MAGMVRGCHEGAVYFQNPLVDKASECAAELSKKTGESHTTECWGENISDGLPACVFVTYCKVIKGESGK